MKLFAQHKVEYIYLNAPLHLVFTLRSRISSLKKRWWQRRQESSFKRFESLANQVQF